MGRSIRLKCNDCSVSYDLRIGQGISDNKIENALGHFDEKTADLIRRKISVLEEDGYWNYRSMIGYCETCRSFVETPTFHIFNYGKKYVTAQKCSCGADVTLIDENDQSGMNDLKCPQCSGKITMEPTGMWD